MYCDYIQPVLPCFLSSFPYEPLIFSTGPNGYTIEEINSQQTTPLPIANISSQQLLRKG